MICSTLGWTGRLLFLQGEDPDFTDHNACQKEIKRARTSNWWPLHDELCKCVQVPWADPLNEMCKGFLSYRELRRWHHILSSYREIRFLFLGYSKQHVMKFTVGFGFCFGQA